MEEITVHLKIDDIEFKVIGPQYAQRKMKKFLMNNVETEKQNAALREALYSMHPERIYANPWEIAEKALNGINLKEELREQALKGGE